MARLPSIASLVRPTLATRDRGFEQWTPDVYAEVKYKKFYAGAELVTHQGRFESTQTSPGDNDYENPSGAEGWKINQWGFALKLQQLFMEDRLKLGFDSSWASRQRASRSLVPPLGMAEQQIGDRTFETFRFHPGYRVDPDPQSQHLEPRPGCSYYFLPSVRYDFIREGDRHAPRRSRRSDLDTCQPVHAGTRTRARPRHRAERHNLLPIEGRRPERLARSGGRLLRHAPVRCALPVLRLGLSRMPSALATTTPDCRPRRWSACSSASRTEFSSPRGSRHQKAWVTETHAFFRTGRRKRGRIPSFCQRRVVPRTHASVMPHHHRA